MSPIKQTAELVAKKHAALPFAEGRLIEKAGGRIDGLSYGEIAVKYPETWGTWEGNTLEYIVNVPFPEGESDLDVAVRLEDLLEELESTLQDKKIVLVTHSGVVQAARYLFGGSKEDIYFTPVPNCVIEVYQ